MSLLNLASDGLPNILVTIVATLQRARKKMTRSELIARIAPDDVVYDEGRMARQTLNRWIELGFFEESDDSVRISSALDVPAGDDATILAAVRTAARQCALSGENNRELWANREAKAADLTRSLAWLLAQDVYRFSYRNIEALEGAQISDELRLMRNDTRQNGLRFWGHFLGFVRDPSGNHVDPTIAVRDSLHRCIRSEDGIPAADFISNLASELPVLDGGRWRLAVEERIERRALPALADGQLSTALSRALRQLLMEGVLSFENRADVGRSIVFTGRDGIRPDYRYSWVRYNRLVRDKKS
jgi:hypothetical protein